MLDIFIIFLFSGTDVFSTELFKGALSTRKGPHVRSGAKFPRLDDFGRAFLFVLALLLTIVASGCGSGQYVPVSGSLLVSPGSVNFGNVLVGHESDSSVNVTNNSASALDVSQIKVSGQSFSLVNTTMPTKVPAGGVYTLQLRFSPIATGNYSGQAVVMDSGGQMIAQVPMQGLGSAQSIPQLTVGTASLNFGSVAVNTAATQSLTLTATGTSPVTISSAMIAGAGFTIVEGSLPATLNPSESVTLQVQFNPTSPGAASGQITICSNSLSGNTTTVNLAGVGAAASSPQTTPQLTVSAASLSFESVTIDTATTQSLTLTSTGTSPVTVDSAAIAGTGFSIVGGSLPVTLNPTQSMTLQIQFNPITTGAASGQLAITSNSASGNTALVTLSGVSTAAPSPQLTLSAATLSFGSVTVNTATIQLLTLTSTGTSPVNVSSAVITGAGFTIVGGSFPATLSPNQSLTLQVQFDPTVTGKASGQLTINSNSSAGSTAVVVLSGTSTTAPVPQLTVSSATLSFGSVTVNTAATQSLTLTSKGTSPVTVSSATLTGTGFTLVGGSLPVTLNPTQSMMLQVQFAPLATGSASGQLTISSNSSAGSTVVVALGGSGAAAPNPQLTFSSKSLSFGNVTMNTTTTQTLTLTSTGTSAVTVSSAAIIGTGFTIVAQSLPATLNPNQSITVQVQFAPSAPGTASGQITITSNSTTGGTTVIALGGTGTAANPQLGVSTTNVSFGSVAVNTPTMQTLTLASTGTTPVTVNSAAITGAGFTLVAGSFPVTLNPAQTLTLQLEFDPTSAGAVTGQLTISSNSSTGGTAEVSLTGTGTSVPHEVDLSWNAPTNSSDPVVGYNIYRLTGTGSFTLINSSPDSSIVYVDSTVVCGSSYSYVVKSVDSSGVESVASNEITVTIP